MLDKYKVEAKSTSSMLVHKFNGKDVEKSLKEKSDFTQAEAHAYRTEDGNLAIPASWFRGCLIEYLVSTAGAKQKTSTKQEVSPRIQILPELISLGTKEFEIDKRAIPVKIHGKIADMDFCIRPIIKSWKVTFTLVSALDKTAKQLKIDLENAGIEQGIGSNRINGYGRFEVVSFNKI